MNFPLLEEVFLKAVDKNDKALSVFLQAEMCRQLEKLQNVFEGYCCADSLKIEMWIHNCWCAVTASLMQLVPLLWLQFLYEEK